MTLNGIMADILANYVRLTEVRPTSSATKCGPKSLVFGILWFLAIFL